MVSLGPICSRLLKPTKCTGKEYGAAAASSSPSAAVQPAVQNEEEVLSGKIDRLGELKAQLAQLEQEIIAGMQKHHFERHYGKNFKAELSQEPQVRFSDPEQVIRLLRELHLLPKVLAPTKTTILRLLTDKDVSAEDKAKLQALLTKAETLKLTVEKTS